VPSTRTRRATAEGHTDGKRESVAVEERPEAIVLPKTAEDIEAEAARIEAEIRAQVASVYEQAMAAGPEAAGIEIAEPGLWWDMALYGPLQPIAPGGPLVPHLIIKAGEPAYVLSFVLLNPFLPLSGGTNAGDVLANFALPFEVRYQTGNLTTWTLGPSDMQATNTNNLTPGQYFYVDLLWFTGGQPGLYEMNGSARILGAAPPHVNAPQFAAYATVVFNIDGPGLFGPKPPGPLRFMVYP
jgi:hypothetical protein